MTVAQARLAWAALVLLCLANVGNYYVYDSIGPVADLLQRQRGFSDSQIGLLGAVYNLPNVLLVLVGGMLVDRFGAGIVVLATACICLVGAVFTAFGPDFGWMVTARLFYGVGAETFSIAVTAGVIQYAQASGVAMALGVNLALGRLGSYGADMSPTWFARSYAEGWQPPLVIAAIIAATSVVACAVYFGIDRRQRIVQTHVEGVEPHFTPRLLLRTGKAYWFLLALCVFWYAVIFAFRSTFAIKYFQHAHGMDLATAGQMNSYVFLASVVATPAFGWLCDRTGRYAPLLTFGAVLLPMALLLMMFTDGGVWMGTALLGVSYSLVPAVMWPHLSRLVPQRIFGTALGLMWVLQNAGIAGANLVAGWLNDSAGASELNPAGYMPMMWYFTITSLVGVLCALALWRIAGRRHHEAAFHAPSPVAQPQL